MLPKPWQWYALEMCRETLQPDEMNALVDACYGKYPHGFGANVQQGDVPSRDQSFARYLAQYVVSPPISLRRSDRYDGRYVTDHYRSHTSERVEWERGDGYPFIGRMMHHGLPQGCKRIRSYGVQATKTLAKIQGLICHA